MKKVKICCRKRMAKIELFWAVHSEALVWTILKHFLSFLYELTFHHKSRKNSPIELWHHDTKIPFWGCDNHFSRKEMCVFNGIRKVHWLCSFALGLRQWVNRQTRASPDVNWRLPLEYFFFSLIHEPYNKQLNNLDRSAVTGKSQTSAYRIDLAIARSIRQGLSLRFSRNDLTRGY